MLVVANSAMAVPLAESITLEVVGGDLDAADDRIVERAERGDVVVSNDIPLAARCLAKGAWVLSPKGRQFSEDSVGDDLVTRVLLAHLRAVVELTRGPPPSNARTARASSISSRPPSEPPAAPDPNHRRNRTRLALGGEAPTGAEESTAVRNGCRRTLPAQRLREPDRGRLRRLP